jgi:hypothetical protein
MAAGSRFLQLDYRDYDLAQPPGVNVPAGPK